MNDLQTIFTEVPGRYDFINKAMTWGQDSRWRRDAARECLVCGSRRLLDLCCGTGDLSIEIARQAEDGTEITGLDFSGPMLEIAASKSAKCARTIEWRSGNAASLPFPDSHFDCVGISFGFRNLTFENPGSERHLAEILRVLKPAGRLVIVETSQPEHGLIRALYHAHLSCFAGVVGAFLSGKKSAYQYLARSARSYFTRHELETLLLNAGFAKVESKPRMFGAVLITSATKPQSVSY